MCIIYTHAYLHLYVCIYNVHTCIHNIHAHTQWKLYYFCRRANLKNVAHGQCWRAMREGDLNRSWISWSSDDFLETFVCPFCLNTVYLWFYKESSYAKCFQNIWVNPEFTWLHFLLNVQTFYGTYKFEVSAYWVLRNSNMQIVKFRK